MHDPEALELSSTLARRQQHLQEEHQALQDLQLAKAAIITIKTQFRREQSALQAELARQLSELRSKHHQMLSDAENQILAKRENYLQLQRRGGLARRQEALEQKQEKAFFREVKDSRFEGVSKWKLRIRDIKLELDKLAVLRADWAATLQAGTDSESRLSVFRSKQAALYETYGRAEETPGEFVLRASKDLEAQLLTAREGLSKAQTTESAKAKAASMPPLYQDPDEAPLHLAARAQRALQEGLGAPVQRDPIIDRNDRNHMPIDKKLLADNVEKERKLLESKKPKVKRVSLRLQQARAGLLEDQKASSFENREPSLALADVSPLQLENSEEAQ